VTEAGRDTLARLGEALRSAGFVSDRVRALTRGVQQVDQSRRRTALRLVLEESADERLALMLTLFRLGEAAPLSRFEELVGLDLEELAALDLVRVCDGEVRPMVRISDVEGLLVMFDGEVEHHNSVVGPSPSSRVSAACTPRVGVARALDLGTGCGVQALLLARHAKQVVATDVNARALRLAALSARLNGLTNIEFRQGSFFEPVHGEHFDLVVANPPYVISPDHRFAYRDAQLPDDDLSRTMLRRLPGVLREGGFATLQGNWIHRSEQKWFDGPDACLAGGSCDALMLRIGTQEPLMYAMEWAQNDHAADPDEYERTVRRWHASYRATSIEQITIAAIILRRRSVARNWHLATSALGDVPFALGAALPGLFEVHDRLAELDGDALLDVRLSVADGARIDLGLPGGEARAVLQCALALGGRRPISAPMVACLGRLNDDKSLRDVLDGLCPAPALEELRVLIKLGYLQVHRSDAAGRSRASRGHPAHAAALCNVLPARAGERGA
jgi:methylase of polypeptide subunit release factors